MIDALLNHAQRGSVLLDITVERKSFGSTTVLHNVHLQLHDREVVSLLGPSGCGKSTLLRIVAGLEKDYQGQLKRSAVEVAFVFQEPRLMPWHCRAAWPSGSPLHAGCIHTPRSCCWTNRSARSTPSLA